MILSTGMRTDIPAFYAKWLLNRIRAGYVCTRNPYNPHQVTKYSLDPKVVDCLAFCTKNPLPLLPHLDRLDAYRQFWFVTITPYGKDIEPYVPDKEKVIGAFREISARVGKSAVGWRYDPVFYGKGFDRDAHLNAFEKIAKALNGYTDSCVVSFLDLYEKVRRNAPGIYPPDIDEQKELGKNLAAIAKENGMTVRFCCEGTHLAECGIDVSGCQSKAVVERAIGVPLRVPVRRSQRNVCDCLLGNDIGAYDSCGHLCKYCYANADAAKVKENMKRHDPASPFLIGHSEAGDVVTEARQKSFIDLQTRIF